MTDNVEKLKEILGSNLVTLAKYHTGDEVRTLAVCNRLDFATLQKLKPLKEIPLVMTKEELTDGSDVFPLEFLNIIQHHEIYYGEDLLKDLPISKEHLRHQLEFEFRSKLIHLRGEYLQFKGKDLKGLILASVPTLIPILEGLIYLKDLHDDGVEDLFTVVSNGYRIDTEILKEIYDIRRGNAKFKKDKEHYVKEIIRILTEIGEIVDELEMVE